MEPCGRLRPHDVLLLLACSVLCAAAGITSTSPATKPNVLFIVSDDLRPTLGVYGTQALTPTLDALAKRGLTFTRAFSQFPWCSPTRQSFMTGRRPDTTQAWTFTTSFRDAIPHAIALPQHFRKQGYYAASVGKVYHGQNCIRGSKLCCDMAAGCCHPNATYHECMQQPVDGDYAAGSWDEVPVDWKRINCANRVAGINNTNNEWCELSPQINESDLADFKIAAAAIARLEAHSKRLKQSKLSGTPRQPLFLAVGFRDNHLPWSSTAEWRALYDVQKVTATQHSATPSFLPVAQGGVPKQAWQYNAWVGPGRHWGDKAWATPAMLQEALRSYMANIAWTDAQVGKVLASLEALQMSDNTIVLFTGDHGQNVGEHNTWTKMTAWEHSVRVPLIIAVPWLTGSHDVLHYGMAEMCDFYKTLSDLANIDNSTLDPGVECDSLAPLFHGNSSTVTQKKGKLYAFSQTNRRSVLSLKNQGLAPYTRLPSPESDTFFDPSCMSTNEELEWMGYTVRSTEWRYTEWHAWNGAKLCARELAPGSSSSSSSIVRTSSTTCAPLEPAIPVGLCWHDPQGRIAASTFTNSSDACCTQCAAASAKGLGCVTFLWARHSTSAVTGNCSLYKKNAPPAKCPKGVTPPVYVTGTVPKVTPAPTPSPRGSEMIELYDHREDTTPLDLDVAEYVNVAAAHADVVQTMRAVLRSTITFC